MRIREIFGIKPDGFRQYIRSKNDLSVEMKERGYRDPVEAIIKLFAQHNTLVTDDLEFQLPVQSLWGYREYDRTPKNGFTGLRSEDEFNELRDDIKRNGVKSPIVFTIKRLSSGNVEAYIGEGNHRILIAKQLGIKTIPVRFHYIK